MQKSPIQRDLPSGFKHVCLSELSSRAAATDEYALERKSMKANRLEVRADIQNQGRLWSWKEFKLNWLLSKLFFLSGQVMFHKTRGICEDDPEQEKCRHPSAQTIQMTQCVFFLTVDLLWTWHNRTTSDGSYDQGGQKVCFLLCIAYFFPDVPPLHIHHGPQRL